MPRIDAPIGLTLGGTHFRAANLSYGAFTHTIPSHSHGSGSYEIHYIAQGYGRALIQGRGYRLTPGTVYVTGPHVTHAQAPEREDPMHEYCVYLNAQARRPAEPGEGVQDDGWQVAALFAGTPFFLGREAQHLQPVLEALFAELAQRRPGYRLQAQALLCQLLVQLVRGYAQQQPPGQRAAAPVSPEQMPLMIEDYFLYEYPRLSLQELAGRLGLGPRQTERLLRRLYGRTFLQKKTEARMNAAAVLLADAGRSVTAVAEQLGYASVEHFSSAFRRYYGLSPRQYRGRQADRPFP